MKLRRDLRFHGLRRLRVRQTWNKYNLFNLSRLRVPPNLTSRTFFQQKWWAKALTRGYHGEHIRESKWERMFSRRLNSVVEMRPTYMAKYDGSEQATGRGSGREEPPAKSEQERRERLQTTNVRSEAMTPYVQMAYAPQERRLDIAVFRALFASSARQARQMVVHGAVKVNGVKMRYPAYQLNPGDMFQVDVEHVLTATGNPKAPESASSKNSSASEATEDQGDEAAAAEEITEPAEEEEGLDEQAKKEREVKDLKQLRERVKEILEGQKGELSGKTKISLRSLSKDIKTAMSRAHKRDHSLPQSANPIDNLTTLFQQLELQTKQGAAAAEAAAAEEQKEASEAERGGILTRRERDRLEVLMREEEENPWDPSKPYRTPWKPREYMSAFAFIPRYLEVNQKICAAVYLRHPVARQGMAEVPTPFPPEVSQLAFNWYLRRR